MNHNELLKVVLEMPGENRTWEFKRLGTDVSVSKIIETIVAMANTDGGIIILGVDDPEKTKLKGFERIYGIEENPEKYDEIGRSISRITPPIPDLWPPLTLAAPDGKNVAAISIPKARDNFFTIDNRVWVRLEKGNKVLTPHEVVKLSYAKGFQHADRELVEVDFDLLKTEYYERWREARKIPFSDISEVLFHTGLARKDENGILKPVRAAVLLFAHFPHTIMKTKCTIRIFQYEGTLEKIQETLNLLSTPVTIEGPAVKQIEEAQNFVLTLLRAGMRLPSSGFVTTYRIPERVIKEAITNAVIHRDYYMKRDIEIRIFEDRVEIESPGLFPSNITTFNIGFVRSEGYRNDLIVKHLREFPNPPNLDRNEGVRAMRAEMDRRNLYPPVFYTYPHLEDAVRVVLFNSVKATEWDKVAAYLKTKEKYVTNEKVRQIVGNPDTSKVSRLLRKWVAQGFLLKLESASKKKSRYRLPMVDKREEFLFAGTAANKN
jgi:ATP-dependent DNA helicase RecG